MFIVAFTSYLRKLTTASAESLFSKSNMCKCILEAIQFN